MYLAGNVHGSISNTPPLALSIFLQHCQVYITNLSSLLDCLSSAIALINLKGKLAIELKALFWAKGIILLYRATLGQKTVHVGKGHEMTVKINHGAVMV